MSERVCERGKSESRSRVIEKERGRRGTQRILHRADMAKYSLLLCCDVMGRGGDDIDVGNCSVRYDGISGGDNIENRLYRIIRRERKAAQKARSLFLSIPSSDTCITVVS